MYVRNLKRSFAWGRLQRFGSETRRRRRPLRRFRHQILLNHIARQNGERGVDPHGNAR